MKQNGFTLIELMIVVAIIGLLAAVAIPQYNQYTKRSKFTEVKTSVSAIKSAVEVCFARNAGNLLCGTTNPDPNIIKGGVTTIMLERAAAATLVGTVALTNTGSAGEPVIISAPVANNDGFEPTDTYILTAIVELMGGENTVADWHESGVGCTKGYC